IEELLRERRQIARVKLLGLRRLDLRERGDDLIRARLEPRVAGRGVHQRERRQVVAGRVSAELDVRRLPASQRLRGRRQARVHAERVEQPIRIEAEEVLLIQLIGLLERTIEQADVRERERARRQRRLLGNGHQRHERGQQRNQDSHIEKSYYMACRLYGDKKNRLDARPFQCDRAASQGGSMAVVRRRFVLGLLIVAVTLAASTARAQVQTGSITGTV